MISHKKKTQNFSKTFLEKEGMPDFFISNIQKNSFQKEIISRWFEAYFNNQSVVKIFQKSVRNLSGVTHDIQNGTRYNVSGNSQKHGNDRKHRANCWQEQGANSWKLEGGSGGVCFHWQHCRTQKKESGNLLGKIFRPICVQFCKKQPHPKRPADFIFSLAELHFLNFLQTIISFCCIAILSTPQPPLPTSSPPFFCLLRNIRRYKFCSDSCSIEISWQ